MSEWKAVPWPGNQHMNPGCQCEVAEYRVEGHKRKVYIYREPSGWVPNDRNEWVPAGFLDSWQYSIEGVVSGLCEGAKTAEEAKAYIALRYALGILGKGTPLEGAR